MFKLLNAKDSSGVLGLIFVLILFYAFILYIFPHGFIAGTSSYWLAQNEDITQYISGFNAYFNEPWRFPLFQIDSINYPSGVRSTFVDIIPLYSFLLKLIIPHSFFPFNPFGFWVGFCFIMSGVSAWYILRTVKINSWFALFALGVLMLTFPALMARLGHISLMSHWIMLFALAFYLKSFAKPNQTLKWSVLLFCAFYINVYLFTMAFAIFLATVATNFNRQSLKVNFLQLCTPVIIIFASLFVTILPLPQASIAQDFGWGYYSMNLLAPINGGAFIKFINAQMPGQYEGFNYLGLGVIVLTFYALYLRAKFDDGFYKRHIFFLALLSLFFIYSLSNIVYIASYHLLDINYPKALEPLFIQFRASGRFFWPVGYAITIFAVISVVKFNKKRSALILTACLLIQGLDLREMAKDLKQKASRDSGKVIDLAEWSAKVNDYDNIYFYPKFRCMQKANHLDTLLPVILLASRDGKNINDGYIARRQPKCDTINDDIAKSDANKSVYIFVKEEYPNEEAVLSFFSNPQNIKCEILNFAYVCKEVVK